VAFEPAVEKVIKQHRRKARMRKLVILLPIIIVFLFGAVRMVPMIFVMQAGNTTSSFGTHLDFMPVLLVPFLMFAVIGGVAYFNMIKPLQRQYDSFAKPLDNFDRAALARWQQGLEAAAVGAGIPTPVIVPISLLTANTIAFEFGGKQAVGVSAEALPAQLSYSEVEAIMAHEVAHITTRTYVHSPFILRDRKILLVLLGVAFLFGLGMFFISPWLMMAPLMILPLAPVFMGYTMRKYWPVNEQVGTGGGGFGYGNQRQMPQPMTRDQMKGPMFDNDIVADSIATKIISEPQALRRAIGKMAQLMQLAPAMPAQRLTYNYLFIGPLKPWAPMPDMAAMQAGLGKPSFFDGAQKVQQRYQVTLVAQIYQQICQYADTRRELIAERLENLQMIQQGTWRAFDQVVGGGMVRTAPEGWR
jgi:Zn-dependent protease with chaperone function